MRRFRSDDITELHVKVRIGWLDCVLQRNARIPGQGQLCGKIQGLLGRQATNQAIYQIYQLEKIVQSCTSYRSYLPAQRS